MQDDVVKVVLAMRHGCFMSAMEDLKVMYMPADCLAAAFLENWEKLVRFECMLGNCSGTQQPGRKSEARGGIQKTNKDAKLNMMSSILIHGCRMRRGRRCWRCGTAGSCQTWWTCPL